MATTVEPRDGTQPYVDADEYIDFQLAKTQSQIKATEILTSASWLGLAALGYVLTFVVLDQWVMPGGFGTWTRAVWLGGLLIGGGSWLTARILLPWFKTVHELYAAKMIESADPTLKSSLLNLIDLQIHDRKSQSALVRTSMEKRAAVELSRVDVDHAIDRQALLRVAYALLGMVVVCSLYVMLSPKDAFSSVQRLLLPASQTAVATRTAIANITPEDTRVLAGELLTVEADIFGQMPKQVTLVYTTADREFVDQPVEMQKVEEGTSRFRGVISGEKGRGLMQNLTYRLEAGDARTRDYNVQVLEPPSSKVESVNYTFPAYMKLEPKKHPGGHIDAWEGTKLALTAFTNLPVQSAMLVMTDTDNPLAKGEEVRMKITNGKELSAEWTLEFRSDGTFARYYHIECKTAAGESDPQPTVYSIKIQPDQRPDVSLLHPTQDLERPANAVVPLLVKASDPDFNLRFVTLRVEKAGEEILSAALLDEERPNFEGTHDLQLEKLSAAGLQPGDEILYWIEARDNKQPHGNRSATPRLKIKITAPAKAEQLKQQLEEDRQKQLQQQQADEANPAPNPNDPNRQPPEATPDKEPRPKKPGEKQQERKPGDPKPREEGQQPDEPGEKPEERPNQPGQQTDKPEGEEQPGQGAKNKPQQGPKGQEQRQPGEKQPGEKQAGEDGADGQNAEKTPNGQQGKPGGKSGKEGKTSKGPGDGAQQDPAQKKQGPADDEEALKKLIERQQQADSNPDESGKDGQQGNEPNGNKPAEGEQPSPGDNKTSGEKSASKNDKKNNGKPQNGGDEAQPDPGQSKPGQNQAQKKAGTEKPGSPTEGQQSKPGEGGEKKPQAADKTNSADKKTNGDEPNADSKPGETQPGQESKPNPNGVPQPGDEKNDKTQSGKTDPNGKAMQKPEAGEKPGQPRGKAGDKDSDNEKDPEAGPGDSPKDPMNDKAGDKKPGDSKAGKTDPMGKKPQPEEGKPGEGATAPGEEKNSGQKQNGPANKPTKEKGPDSKEAPEQGPGNGQKPDPEKKPGPMPKPNGDKSPDSATGEETPAEEGPDAVKKKATGDEKGPATGQKKPDADAPQAKGDLERKPGSEPGAMRKSDKPQDPNAKPEAGSPEPNSTKAKSDGSARSDDPMNGKGKDAAQPREKRPGEAPSQDTPNPGKGRPNQKSQQPDSGEQGGGTPQDKGTPGSKQEGKGDTEPKPGDKTPDTEGKGGKPGDKPGEGSKTQPSKNDNGDKKPGAGGEPSSDKPEGQPMPGDAKKPGAEGKPGSGEGKPGEGKPGQSGEGKPDAGKSGSGKPGQGKPGGQPGRGGQPGEGANNNDQPGNEAGNGAGKPNQERRNLPPAEQDQEAQEAAEKANEEFARKASSLVLKKLRKDLDRGQVDQELLDELGWKKDDMERFVQRLEKQLADTSEDTSPESIARRRQFEETLKTLGLSSKTKLRKAAGGKPTRVNELGDRKIAPPPEYQELFEEYTKDLAKPTTKK